LFVFVFFFILQIAFRETLEKSMFTSQEIGHKVTGMSRIDNAFCKRQIFSLSNPEKKTKKKFRGFYFASGIDRPTATTFGKVNAKFCR
jgi:hypothetical protein